jgi:hypothetical protein
MRNAARGGGSLAVVRHRAFLPGLCALLVALYLTSWREVREARDHLPPPFRGIERADGLVLAKIRAVWSREFSGAPDIQALRAQATELGEPASRALLQVLLEHYKSANWDRYSYGSDDEHEEPEGLLIGELMSDETGHALMRAVADRTLPHGMRRAMVVALCRRRCAYAAETLTRIACDRGEGI